MNESHTKMAVLDASSLSHHRNQPEDIMVRNDGLNDNKTNEASVVRHVHFSSVSQWLPPEPAIARPIDWPTRRCGQCGSCRPSSLKRCSRCKRMWYCSVDCHIEHHTRHRIYCCSPSAPHHITLMTTHASTHCFVVDRIPPKKDEWRAVVTTITESQLLHKYRADGLYLRTPQMSTAEPSEPWDPLDCFNDANVARCAVFIGDVDTFALLVDAGVGRDPRIAQQVCLALWSNSGICFDHDIERRRQCIWIWLHASHTIPHRLLDEGNSSWRMTHAIRRQWYQLWLDLYLPASHLLSLESILYLIRNTAVGSPLECDQHIDDFRFFVRHGLEIDHSIDIGDLAGQTAISLCTSGNLGPLDVATLLRDREFFLKGDARTITACELTLAVPTLLPNLVAICISYVYARAPTASISCSSPSASMIP